jgi:peptide/nickel transport system substrate-binding protein
MKINPKGEPGTSADPLPKLQMSRRGVLLTPLALGAGLLLPHRALAQTNDDFQFVDPGVAKIYKQQKGYFADDAVWREATYPRIQWPKKGQRVPEFEVLVAAAFPFWLDAMRKFAADAEKVGLKYKITQVSLTRWLDSVNKHHHGDVELHPAVPRVERIDPSEWLTSRAYGPDRRNYGEWVNLEYDKLIQAQAGAGKHSRRLKLVQEAQAVIADDLYITQLGWGPSIVQAYNSAAWEGVVKARGFGISDSNMFWTHIKAKPKTSRRRMVVGTRDLIDTLNLTGAGNLWRAIGRMIYDRLGYLDEHLNPVPWALESWENIDDRTWEVVLRPGMKFHDGKPVTLDDLKFTLDFMMKYERGIFWTANRYLESAEILDPKARKMRLRFKQPYAEFETAFVLLNVILPKHLWDGRMEKEKLTDPRQLSITHPIGSGPFKFTRYQKDTDLLLTANKEHFAAPQCDELLYVVVPSIDGELGRLESGEIDFTEDLNLTPSQAKELTSQKNLTIVQTPDINWFQAVPRVSWLPFRDFQFRLAWQHTFDREFLVKVVWEGAGRVPASNTFLVDTNPWNNPNLPPVPKFDLDKARQILKEAGYSWDGEGRLLYPDSNDKAFVERVNKVVKSPYHWGGLKMAPR